MITSFSRLFRQIFGGAKAHPVEDAPTGAVGAVTEAQEAAQHRENLKRAMEVAFATPTAEAEDPPEVAPVAAEPELVLVEAIAETVVERDVAEPVAAADPEEEEDLDEDEDDDDDFDDDEEEARAGFVETAAHTEPLVAETAPAAELVEDLAEQGEVALALGGNVADEQADSAPGTTSADEVVAAVEVIEPSVPVSEEPAVFEETSTAEIFEEALTETAAAVEVPAEELAVEAEAPPAEDVTAEVSAQDDDVEVTPEAVAEGLAAVATKAKRAAKKKAPAKKKTATKKRTTAKKGALAEDAVWLSDAIAYSLSREWTSVWTPPEDASGAERLEVFREKAAAGELTVWGRVDGAEEWQAIKATYWKTSFVEPLSFLMGRENTATEPKPSKGKKQNAKYTALKVSQAAIEELWPAGEADADADVKNAA